MSEQDFSNLDESLIKYVRRGVLWADKKPVYIIELVKERDTAYVLAFEVQTEGVDPKSPPMKKGQFIPKKTAQFNQQTVLGRIADALYSRNKTEAKSWRPSPPVFVCPVVHNQRDTFSGKTGSGFFEHTPDRWTTQGGQRKYERGTPTGVFVGLDSIVWEDKVTIPADSVVKAFSAEGGNDFYDFTGEDKNENPNNPLGGAYKE